MNSSGSMVTKQNQFQSKPMVGKTHCHSSRGQRLSKTKKKTTLSPVRSNQRDNSKSHRVNTRSQQQFERQDGCPDTTDGEPIFSEIWPSTECGSSPTSITTLSDMETNMRRHSEVDAHHDSVLAKYIERFRHGQPQSREERQQDRLPFWWTSPSTLPPSSTLTKSINKDVVPPLRDHHGHAVLKSPAQYYSDRSPSPHRGSLTNLSDTSQGDFEDSDIIHIQEKASRLLQRGEYTVSDGSIPVTSEGLGSSDFSSPVSVDEPVRRPFIPSLLTCTSHAKTGTDSFQAVTFHKSAVIPTLAPLNRPEEDILFQWRLRRKMEKARESVQTFAHSSLHGSGFQWQVQCPPASQQSHKQKQSIEIPESSQGVTYSHMDAPHSETREPCPTSTKSTPSPAFVASSSLVSHPQAIAHVPAHMHFLCDVLPCPSQPSHANMQQSISQRLDPSTKVKTPAAQTSEQIHISPSEPSSSGGIEGGSAPHAKEAEIHKKVKDPTKHSEKDKRKAVTSTREQKKKTTRVPKEVITTVEQQQLQRYLDSSSQNCHHPPPPSSPIHSALGEVVSEVLFPTIDSSPAQRSPVLPVFPQGSTSEPPQSSVSLCNTQNPVEVISQLLQEAEDSDENEFEDDPLLQVLRRQRKWVKEQIREVDTVLHGLLDDQQVT